MNAPKPVVSSLALTRTDAHEADAWPIDDGLFRGALFGLYLAPVAMRLTQPGAAAHSSTASSSIEIPPDSLIALSYCFERLRTFLQIPELFDPELTGPESALNSVPILLRYCDDPSQRWQMLSAWAPTVSAPCLVLGDVLALTVQWHWYPSRSLTGEQILTQLTDYACDHAPQQAKTQTLCNGLDEDYGSRYLRLWSAIATRVSTVLGTAMSATPDTSFGRFSASLDWLERSATDADRQVIGGITSAFLHRCDYGASVREASHYRGIAPWVAGLVSGAMGRYAALPVLWQLQADQANQVPVMNAQQCHRLAERLHARWSGQWCGPQSD
ncbi:MAG: hypothetical protein AAFQ40_02185 [Cyanobacteria bacterium J06623_5]